MSRLGESVWYISAFAIVALLGVANIHLPFVADHAVAVLAGKAITAGQTLYVDFWDNKMPALFWFYAVAGSLFGFDEKGIHLFELIWMLTFSIFLAWSLRKYFYHPWLSALAVIGVIGFYYAAARPNQLALPEPIATLPIFICAWGAWRSVSTAPISTKPAFISGLAAGVTVVFKLIFAPICIAIWIAAACHLHPNPNIGFRQFLSRYCGSIIAGGLIVCSSVILKFWFDGGLAELYWTAFVYPPQALIGSPKADSLRLLTAVSFVASTYIIWFVPMCISLVWWVKENRDPLTSILLAWLIAGCVVIFIQRFSWWTYHLYLIFAPIALLGVRGLDVSAKWISESCQNKISVVTLSGLLAITFCTALPLLGGEKINKVTGMMVLHDEPVLNYRTNVREEYGQIHNSAQYVNRKQALKGDILVFGNPLYYLFTDRSPATPIVGWPWEYFLQSQWLELPEQIRDRKPVYILIDDRNNRIMKIRQGGVRELIYERYVAASKTHDGTWFQLKKSYLKE